MVEPEGIWAEYGPGGIANSGIWQTKAASDGPKKDDISKRIEYFPEQAWSFLLKL